MARLNQNRADLDAVKSGVWVTYLKDEKKGDLRLRVASMDSPEYSDAISEIAAKVAGGSMTEEEGEKASWVASARYLLLDWKNNYEDDDGESVAYTEERAIAYLTDPAHVHLREFVQAVARNRARFFAEEVAKAVGN